MTLVDTSSWVHQLRPRGDPQVRQRVENLLRRGEAAWCPPVRLELWAGVLRKYASVLPDLPITDAVWLEAERLAERGRRHGLRAPAMDILIAACARVHRVKIEHHDSDFDWLLTT